MSRLVFMLNCRNLTQHLRYFLIRWKPSSQLSHGSSIGRCTGQHQRIMASNARHEKRRTPEHLLQSSEVVFLKHVVGQSHSDGIRGQSLSSRPCSANFVDSLCTFSIRLPLIASFSLLSPAGVLSSFWRPLAQTLCLIRNPTT